MPADNREKAFIDICNKNNVEYFIKKFDINAYNEMNYYEYIKNSGELQWGMDFFDSHLRVGGDDMHTGEIGRAHV